MQSFEFFQSAFVKDINERVFPHPKWEGCGWLIADQARYREAARQGSMANLSVESINRWSQEPNLDLPQRWPRNAREAADIFFVRWVESMEGQWRNKSLVETFLGDMGMDTDRLAEDPDWGWGIWS